MSNMLTVRQVAEHLQVSVATIYCLCNQGKLPNVRVGMGRGTIRVKVEDLTAFIEASKADTHRLMNAAGLKHLTVRPAGSP